MALRLDPMYVISFPWGVLRLAEAVLSLIILICIAILDYEKGGTGFITFTATGSLITALVILALYSIHIPDTFGRLPWSFIETVTSGFWALFHFISGCISAAFSSEFRLFSGNMHSTYAAMAFFCFVCVLVFGLNAFLMFRHWRIIRVPASGTATHTVTTYEHTTTTVSSPAKY